MMPTVDVVVAIPAHNEEEFLPDCLDAVLTALTHARDVGLLRDAVISVVAHHCTDATSTVAREILGMDGASTGSVRGIVAEDGYAATIADVRRLAVDAGLPHVRRGQDTWVFSTDADSLPPRDWITGTLAAAGPAAAVAGMVELFGWNASDDARAAYDRIIAHGIHGQHHDHVYGANLAVRLDAYLDVGGFAPVPHGEDHALVDALREASYTVATPLHPVVLTSGREQPRCPDGLGALLRTLSESRAPEPVQ